MVGNTFYFEWEVKLMEYIQAHMGNFGVKLASFITLFGEEMMLIAILGFVYWAYDKKWGKYIGTNIAAVLIVNPLLKTVFVRRRPYFDNPGIKCLKPVDASADIYDITAQDFSFPSGHSSNASSVYGSIARYKKKPWLTVLCVVIILLVGVSRFCVGVHYPTDVLVGWLLGLAILFLVPWLQEKVANDLLFYAGILVLSLAGFFFCKTNEFYTGYGMALGMFAGFLFEEKCVHFENTKSVWKSILRVAGGFVLFFGLNEGLKLPFNKEFLETAAFLPFLVRTLRYAVVVFVLIGVYPMVFNAFDKKKADGQEDGEGNEE